MRGAQHGTLGRSWCAAYVPSVARRAACSCVCAVCRCAVSLSCWRLVRCEVCDARCGVRLTLSLSSSPMAASASSPDIDTRLPFVFFFAGLGVAAFSSSSSSFFLSDTAFFSASYAPCEDINSASSFLSSSFQAFHRMPCL